MNQYKVEETAKALKVTQIEQCGEANEIVQVYYPLFIAHNAGHKRRATCCESSPRVFVGDFSWLCYAFLNTLGRRNNGNASITTKFQS